MSVKGNQENLRFAIADRLRFAPSTSLATMSTKDKGHGRSERRTLTVMSLSKGEDLGWPGARQIGSLKRERINRRTGEILSRETTYFVSSLSPEQASPDVLLAIARGHWTIENRVHYVRDVTLAEDASQIRQGSSPQVMAAFRNLVLTLLRRIGVTNVATALIRNAVNPLRPLAYLLM
ncbi:MAG: ISAs1 family transposase [Caldilineales bacterium]|nr:ISAs1 family transposase [Caldilineales bacterium]